MTHLNNLLKNKLLLQKNYHLQESSIDNWPFWMLEQNIKIVNELTEEEEKLQKKQEEQQNKSIPNFNPSSYMSQINNISSKFK